MPNDNVGNVATSPYKEMEFETFLREIGNVNIANWSIMAEALGVSVRTIDRWREHPLAKAAIANALQENIAAMKKAGEGDWKMHREMIKLLGIKDKTVIEHKNLDEVLDDLEEENINDVASKAQKQMVAADPSIQNP